MTTLSLRCRAPSGVVALSIDPTAPFSALQAQIEEKTSVAVARQARVPLGVGTEGT